MKCSVITEIVENDHCIGCGICAALCPREALTMQWNSYGEFNPIGMVPCTTECGFCQEICPFAVTGEDEDTIGKDLYGYIPGITHRSETGYYLASFVGYSEKHRLSSASGGMMTWLLERLLAEGMVDHVACVAPNNDPNKLFSFALFDNLEGVNTGAGSAYYPVEMSEVIRIMLSKPGKYAITGLPCFIKAVRLAQKRNKKLRDRIVVTVGLTCGQLKCKHFTEYIAELAGVQGKVMAVRYRRKSPIRQANNFLFAFMTEGGDERTIFWNDGISESWTNRWFTPNACNYCDDVFAECADITFMDAWLQEYSSDWRGTSLMLVRSPLVMRVVSQGGEISLNSIPIEKVVLSQAGVVAIKRQHLAYRTYLDLKNGVKFPKKRVAIAMPINPFLRQEVVLKEKMRVLSRDLFDHREGNTKCLREGMRPYLRQLQKKQQIERFIMLPTRIIRALYRRHHG